ncbi:RND transporter [Sphingopyxis sp. H067]|uniref:efflux RND transporter periplasmic adaptor subunit n=1 Tax=unclassified Sphingopyxis TaxID=2614943 RepID=UPI000736957D|nr:MULTISPECIES: efflux RND transporter periplasmic adaptor subunit [unclassified Sphingopyxis]KTE23709.1 RND transporter [Sphingopyxis sp. H057]KTE82480.1 RND transporter [Sphingopyxis sp. H067]
MLSPFRRPRYRGISAPGLAALALMLSACGGSAPPPAERAVETKGETLVLRPSTVTEWKDVGALVTSVDMADARARIPGILESLTIREGDLVRKGQVIGRVVDSRLGYEGAAYGAQAAAAQAQVAQAEAELARVKYLHANGVYTQARLDQAEAAARAARAQVNAAKAQQSAVGAVAGQGAVVAPSAGRVLTAQVPAGSAVAAGTSIATITSGPMVLRLELPETLAGKVRVGSSVLATGLTEGAKDVTPRATVSRVYPSVTGGQMAADVQMPGLASNMVGRRITARVATGERQALVVPRRFVETSYGIDYVTIRVGKDSASRVPVQIAPSDDPARVEILSGAATGDTLIAPSAGARP